MRDNASLIFPTIQTLPKELGEPRIREDVRNQLYQDASAYADFQKLLPQNYEIADKTAVSFIVWYSCLTTYAKQKALCKQPSIRECL